MDSSSVNDHRPHYCHFRVLRSANSDTGRKKKKRKRKKRRKKKEKIYVFIIKAKPFGVCQLLRLQKSSFTIIIKNALAQTCAKIPVTTT